MLILLFHKHIAVKKYFKQNVTKYGNSWWKITARSVADIELIKKQAYVNVLGFMITE